MRGSKAKKRRAIEPSEAMLAKQMYRMKGWNRSGANGL